MLLGQIIQAVTTKSWSQYVTEAVLDPLGMKHTFGRPADVIDKEQLTSGHFTCKRRVIGPFSYLNSTMIASAPSNAYYATHSMVASIDDMTKLSHALLRRDKRLFRSSKTLKDMLTGHNIKSDESSADSIKLDGFTNISDATAVTTGFGFDIIGNVLESQPYFDKSDITSVAGWLPTQEIGVLLLANGYNAGSNDSDSYRLYAMPSYLVKLFMGVPLSRIDREFQAWVAWAGTLQPDFPCDSHYFDGVPWEKLGVEIPESSKKALVGTYCAVKSPGYNGNVTIARDDTKLTLQYGAYTKRLVATETADVFLWALERFAINFWVNVWNLNTTKPLRIVLDFMFEFVLCDES
ncbi:hypothetical protein AC1031_014364 [Aphanomyces cochlioides]|nr:hypothetical protein AC1031_014364 [Aphanomyces cochlioides]